MNIGFVTRLDAFIHRGGDTVQLEKLAGELRAMGHRVNVHTGMRFPLQRAWDVVHVFNLQRPGETAAQVERGARHAPVVLSPIYGNTSALDARGRSRLRSMLVRTIPDGIIELGKQARRVMHGLGEVETVSPLLRHRPATLRRRVLDQCSGVYPNSRWEADGLRPLMAPGHHGHLEVVANGVDIGLLDRGSTADAFRARWKIDFDRFVVSVARFDERKNNLGLIRAALEADVPCVLIGNPAPLHVEYFHQCQREASRSPSIRILCEALSQEELTGAYRAAHAHALPSWLETPGLVSLEAGLCGANLVLGECPPVREYFAERAWYCAPGDIASIASALRGAHGSDRNLHGLDDFIARRFSWRQVAEAQLACYGRALQRAAR